jgi:thioredoxin 1
MRHIRTSSELKLVVETHDKVVVDFYADWCGPCKMMTPLLEDLSYEYLNDILFVKVDVDAAPELAQEHEVMSIPTIKIYKDNKLIDSLNGFIPKSILKAKILQ